MGLQANPYTLSRISIYQNKTMNQVDISIINRLKANEPDIFYLYFNEDGIIPNLNLDMRHKAQTMFQHYSTENFDQFIQRYRNLVWKPREIPCSPDSTLYPNWEEPEAKFNAFHFLAEKIKNQDYTLLEFQSDEGVQEVVTDLSRSKLGEEVLKNLLEHVKVLNKINRYDLLEI